MHLHDSVAAEPQPGVNPSEQDCDHRADGSAVDKHAHRTFQARSFPAHHEQFGGRSHEKQGDREMDRCRMQLLHYGHESGLAHIRMATGLVMASARFVVRAGRLASIGSLAHLRHGRLVVRIAIGGSRRGARLFAVLFVAMSLNGSDEEQACGEQRQK